MAHGLSSSLSHESLVTKRLPFPFSLSCTGEGNGSPLQCSCLESPRDRGARWVAVYGVAQSWARLMQLSSSSSNSSNACPFFACRAPPSSCSLPSVAVCHPLSVDLPPVFSQDLPLTHSSQPLSELRTHHKKSFAI